MSLSDKQMLIEQALMLIGHFAYWKVFVAKIPYMKERQPHYTKCDYCKIKMEEPEIGFKIGHYLYSFCCEEHATAYLDETPVIAQKFDETFNNEK